MRKIRSQFISAANNIVKEEDFYVYYGSFEALKTPIWNKFFLVLWNE